MSLQDSRILIVGGGSGIGYAVAEAARTEGADVTIASTDAVKLEAAADRLGGAAWARLDLTDEAAIAAYFAQSGAFDHIVSTAGDWGKARRGPFAEMDMADAKALFEVRFWGAAKLAKHGAPMLTPGGSLTVTSGMSAFRPQRGSAMATAMAGSIAHLVYGLCVEFAPARVNGVFPGGVATSVFENLPSAIRGSEEARFSHQPIPRIARPEEIAEAYIYLMKCSYVTGQVLQVDGGGRFSG